MKIAFDIDQTLWLVKPEFGRSVPNDDLIPVLKWFYKNGDEVFLWSSGGIEYTVEIATKLGIVDMVKINMISSFRIQVVNFYRTCDLTISFHLNCFHFGKSCYFG